MRCDYIVVKLSEFSYEMMNVLLSTANWRVRNSSADRIIFCLLQYDGLHFALRSCFVWGFMSCYFISRASYPLCSSPCYLGL